MPHTLVRLLIVLVLPAALVAPLPAQTAAENAVAAAGRYLQRFTDEVAGVVLEERYLQRAQGRVMLARELVSDLAIMADSRFGWIEFRDVFEVDGSPIRDRQDRVVELFTNPSSDVLAQARRIVAEGARHNLNPVGVRFDRTLNLPLAALMYLREDNQSRSEFRRVSLDSVSGHRVLIVRFEEKAEPRLIESADNAAARGSFWIEQESGQVLRTQLVISSRHGTTNIQATIDVEYREEEALGIWLPRNMEESYNITDGLNQQIASISGLARYSNVRKFRVNIEENVDESELTPEAESTPPAVAP